MCAKVKMLLLKAKLDVVTVTGDHLLSFMNISDPFNDTWVTIIWKTKKKSVGKDEKMTNANRLENVTFSS